MGLYAQETWINSTEGYGHGESDVYETFTESMGELYRAMRREYGRCDGRVFIGHDDPTPIGWIFTKRQKYEDSNETYLLETWVTVHTAPPTRTIEYHYAEITQ